MTNEEMDRRLAKDDAPPLSPLFTAKVMAAVRRAAAEPRPLRFPWRPAIACAAIVIAASLGDVASGGALSAAAAHAVPGTLLVAAAAAGACAWIGRVLVAWSEE